MQVFRSLPALVCPGCHGEIASAAVTGKAPSASTFRSCLRKCDACGIGASNTRDSDAVTFIYRDPIESIPLESRHGADEALRRALNEHNRSSKRARFGFVPTSEDALTWVIFTYLLRAGLLLKTLQRLGLAADDPNPGMPSLLLWGVPVDDCSGGEELRGQLEMLCMSLGENPQSLSEPDVIIDLGRGGLIFIEVKHRSGNDRQDPNYVGWKKYRSPELAWDMDVIRDSGCYELARNWRLLHGLASNRRATLINLGPLSLFNGKEGERLDRFAQGLNATKLSEFRKLSWNEFLSDALLEAPDWFIDFCSQRRVINDRKPDTTMRQNIKGSGSMTASLSMGEARHDASPSSLLQTARDFLSAAEMLDPALAAGPFGLVSAQCLELTLKASLMACGVTYAELKNDIGHNIGMAWSRCVEHGVCIDAEMPAWATLLGAGHRASFLFRYGKDNTGILLPSKDTVLNGLRGVLTTAQGLQLSVSVRSDV